MTAEIVGVDWQELRAAAATVWGIAWVWALIATGAALAVYGGRGWRWLRRRVRRLPEHLPRRKPEGVRPERWDDLAA